jgi:hypothetical protein
MGVQKATLTLRTEGEKLFGTNRNDNGVVELANGKISGRQLTWTMKLKRPFPMTLEHTVTIDDSIFRRCSSSQSLVDEPSEDRVPSGGTPSTTPPANAMCKDIVCFDVFDCWLGIRANVSYRVPHDGEHDAACQVGQPWLKCCGVACACECVGSPTAAI